jgi:hypothetical protein
MKVLVCGSRDWEDRNAIGNRISALWREHGDEVTVIHGGAKGADQIANSFARMFGLQRRVFRPDYEQFGRDRSVRFAGSLCVFTRAGVVRPRFLAA